MLVGVRVVGGGGESKAGETFISDDANTIASYTENDTTGAVVFTARHDTTRKSEQFYLEKI